MMLAAPFAEAQLIIEDRHSITPATGSVVPILEPIIGAAGTILDLEGDLRVDLSGESPDFLGTVFIRGAELRFHEAGHMNGENTRFIIENGGALILDTTGLTDIDHLGNNSIVRLNGGTLQLLGALKRDTGEAFGTLELVGGANAVDIQHQVTSGKFTQLQATNGLQRSGTATLNLTANKLYGKQSGSNRVRLYYSTTASPNYLINKIIPWATVDGEDWAALQISTQRAYLIPLASYQNSAASNSWAATHNVSLKGAVTLLKDRTINSLRFLGTAPVLNLGGKTLTLGAGALLSTGANDRITGTGSLTSSAVDPALYLHIYGDALTFDGEATLSGRRDLVKVGPGSLIFASDAEHSLGTITIHEGVIELQDSHFSVAGPITVGDGAGKDTLKLRSGSTNPISHAQPGQFPSITLHGNPYGKLGDGATLSLGAGTQQHLNALHIQQRGHLDFEGGTVATPSILYLDHLSFSDSAAQLTIHNWEDRANYLLVKRSIGDSVVPPLLPQIHFEGYGPARWTRHYLPTSSGEFSDYWQITPLPEPSTYGAILGTVGLGIAAGRRRKIRVSPI